MRIIITQRDAPPPLPTAVAGALVASPGGQSGATVCAARYNIFGTVASDTGCVLKNILGSIQSVVNGGAFPLAVYPPAGTQFQGQDLNVPVSIAVGNSVTFAYDGNTTWYVIA